MDAKSAEARDNLLRDYAAGRVSWRSLQDHGFADYVQVLAGLGELGLRPPIAEMEGPNLEARIRGAGASSTFVTGSVAPMSGPFSLIVTDTSPLLTLVLADSLDVLLRPGLAISIPDAVYIEATRVRGAPGAEQIVEWINARSELVRIVPTDIGIDQQRRIEEGRSTRGLGEQAAIEALDRFFVANADAEALLLFEDSDIAKRRAIVDDRVGLISTGDFLRELEAAGLIQSSDFILDRAAEGGRNVERQREAGRETQIRDRFREQLVRGDDSSPGRR